MAVAVTGHQPILGCLVGYWVGFLNILLLQRETIKSSELGVRSAIIRMRGSLVTRLGMITIIFVALARLSTGWLIYFTVGIATGLVVSILNMIFYEIHRERREEKNG